MDQSSSEKTDDVAPTSPEEKTSQQPLPAESEPAAPEVDKPVEPEAPKPVEPEVEKPAAEEADKPVVSEVDKPTEPELEKHAEPEAEKPAEPEADKPAAPANEQTSPIRIEAGEESPREENKGEEQEHDEEEKEEESFGSIQNAQETDTGPSADLKAIIDAIKQRYEETGELYEDPDFPATDVSLYKDPTTPPEYARDVPIVDWKRPQDFSANPQLVVDGMTPGDIMQGILGDCWLLGAFCCLGTKNELLNNLIVYNGMQYGVVVVQFFKNGSWLPVVIDTRLPCNPKTKKLIYAHCQRDDEFWICFLEKAYAKLYKNYEELNGGKMAEALVDLTGGVTEKLSLKQVLGEGQPAQVQALKAAELWKTIKQSYQTGYLMGCAVSEKDSKVEMSPEGIVINHAYGILSVREIQGLKLIRIRNPWGRGEWRGSFSDDDDSWDNYKGLREALGHELKDDGIFWMEFKDWYANYNKLYIAKIFPATWQQYSIPCAWKGKTNGGPPHLITKADQPYIDSDDKWFNNPQIRITITKSIKNLYISLMQPETKMSKAPYAPCSFYLFKAKSKYDRLWEPIKDDVVDCPYAEGENVFPQREVLRRLNLELEEKKKEQSYVLVPHLVDTTTGDRQFWIRIFSSEPIEVCLLPETLEVEEFGIWSKDMKQGPRLIDGVIENPNWCENPQYFLNLKKPTHVKIVLKRLTGLKKKNLGANIGMLISKSELDKYANFAMDKTKKIEKRKKQMQVVKEALKMKKTKKGAVSFVQIDKPRISKTARKLRINPKEWFVETQYKNPTVAAFYRLWHQTAGPFIIVPSLSRPIDKDVTAGKFSLTIYSSQPVELVKLDEAKNIVVTGQWKKTSAGGSHLHSDEFVRGTEASWQLNPKYLLVLKGEGKAEVDIVLSRPNWKMGDADKSAKDKQSTTLKERKKAKTIVGTMLGVYIFENRGQKMLKRADIKEDIVFYPKSEVILTKTLECKETGYIVMPCTFEDQQEGPFMISVTSTNDFIFKEYGNE